MKQLILFFAMALAAVSCDKRDEKAMNISGIWEVEETVITSYANNEAKGDSTVNQAGRIIFNVSGDLDYPCVHNLNYAPCIADCYWDIPKKKLDQLFFYSYDESSFSIYSSSCMVEKLTKNKLVLMKVAYDNDLNILQKTVWKFRRVSL